MNKLSLVVLLACCIIATGCIHIENERTKPGVSVSLASKSYPPNPSDHPIDLYLFDELAKRGWLTKYNQKLKNTAPKNATQIASIRVHHDGDGPSLEAVVRDMITETRKLGGDAIVMEGYDIIEVVDESSTHYRFDLIRY